MRTKKERTLFVVLVMSIGLAAVDLEAQRQYDPLPKYKAPLPITSGWKHRQVMANCWCAAKQEDAERFVELLRTRPKETSGFWDRYVSRTLMDRAVVESVEDGPSLMRVRDPKKEDCWTLAAVMGEPIKTPPVKRR